MITLGKASRILFVFLTATTVFLAGCAGHGSSVIPSMGAHGMKGAPGHLTPFAASDPFEQLILQSSPTQYFELEDTACCAASNIGSSGVNGIYTSSNVTYSLAGPLQGETSTAVGLPGNSGTTAISMGVSLPNPSATSAFTVEDWVFPTFTSIHTTPDAYYTIWGYNGTHRLLISNQSTAQGQLLSQFGSTSLRSKKKLTANAWNQVAFVYDGATVSLYINGALDNSIAATGVAFTSAYWLGQYDASANYKLDGRIAQHMVFPSALSATVVQTHFSGATSGLQQPSPTPSTNPTGSPQFIQRTSGAQFNPSTINVTYANAPTAGDVLLVFFHNNGTTANAPITYTAPSGWVQVDLDTMHSANTYQSFYHVVGTSESGSYAFTPSCACREQVWSALEFSGVNASSPIDAHGFAYVPKSSTTWTTPSETPTQAGDLAIVSMMPTSLGSLSWTNASGWSLDFGPEPTWSSEVIQQSQAGTAPVSETSMLSLASYGYAAIVLLAPAGTGSGGGPAKVDWPTWGMKPTRNSYNPVETTLTTSNVGGLHQIWATTAGGVFTDEPVIATNVTGTSEGTADVLYVGDEHADLYAMDANTGSIIWTKTLQTQFLDPNYSCQDMPDGLYGISGTPTIDRARNLVFAVDAMGNLDAFDLATGTQKIGPVAMWPFQNGVNITNDYGGLNEDAAAGIIYVPAAAHCGLPNYGGIMTYNLASGAVAQWFGDGGPPNTRGGVWGPGGAVIDPRNATNPSMNDIYFGTGAGDLGPGDYAYNIVRLTSSLSVVAANNPVTQTCCPDLDFGATPVVFTPSSSGCGRTLLADENKNGALYVYDADNISAGPLQTIQIGSRNTGGTNLGSPAYDPTHNIVVINNGGDSSDATLSPAIFHGLVAFTVTASCQFQFAWQQTVGPSNTDDGPPAPPTVANGVVYYADGPGTGCTPVIDPTCTTTGDFYAFDAGSGAMLFHATLPGPLFTPPVVVNGHVYLTTWNGGGPGIVYSFGL